MGWCPSCWTLQRTAGVVNRCTCAKYKGVLFRHLRGVRGSVRVFVSAVHVRRGVMWLGHRCMREHRDGPAWTGAYAAEVCGRLQVCVCVRARMRVGPGGSHTALAALAPLPSRNVCTTCPYGICRTPHCRTFLFRLQQAALSIQVQPP